MKNPLLLIALFCLLLIARSSRSQTVGSYSTSTVIYGQSLIVLPSSAPSGVTHLLATAPSLFRGQLNVDPVSGAVRIINPHPAGTFAISVRTPNSILQSFSLTVTNPTCSPGNFNTPFSIPVSTVGPHRIIPCDLNGDGNTDLLTSSTHNATVSFALGNGSGSFTTGSITPISIPVFNSINSADVNGDGNSDIILSLSNSPNNIAVYISNGNGTFQAPTYYNSSAGSTAIGDINNDGALDILISTNNRISFLFGTGTGTFTVGNPLFNSINNGGIQCHDFNNDGNLDFSISTTTDFRFYLGDGTGAFPTNTIIPNLSHDSYSVADINQDGVLDLFISRISSSNNCRVWLGNGDGTFSAGQILTTPQYETDCILTDLSGDGYPDAVVANYSTTPGQSTITVFINDGAGIFSSSKNFSVVYPNSLCASDFNMDGIIDLAIGTNLNPGSIAIYPGSSTGITVKSNNQSVSDGSIIPSTNNNTDFGSYPLNYSMTKNFIIQNPAAKTLVISDINFTGPDMGEYSINESFPIILSGNATDTIPISHSSTLTGSHDAVAHIISADCNSADFDFALHSTTYVSVLGNYSSDSVVAGKNTVIVASHQPDGSLPTTISAPLTFKGLLVVNQSTGDVFITNARPAGVYNLTVSKGPFVTRTFTLNVLNPACSNANFTGSSGEVTGTQPAAIAVADFNNDGYQDLITADFGAAKATIKLGSSSGIFTTAPDVALGTNPSGLAIADFNNDGFTDFASSSKNTNQLNIRLGNGDGTFNTAGNVSTGASPSSVCTGDFNNDGKPDLAVGNSTTNTMSVRLGNGDGTFNISTDITVGTNPITLVTSDFNKDGKLDIVVGLNTTSSPISVMFGNGLGGFSRTIFSAGLHSYGIAPGDYNNDGNPDFACTISNSGRVDVFLGNGMGSFTGSIGLSVGVQPRSIVAGDFNSDGNLDVAVGNSTGNSIVICTGNGLGKLSLGQLLNNGISNPLSIVSGDFNNDDIQDLAIANYGSASIAIRTGIYSGMEVTGNSQPIADGSVAISAANFTDVGTVEVNSFTPKTFTIINNGGDSLIVNGITFTGTDSASFSITGITFPVRLGLAGTKNFSVKFAPLVTGIKNATVHILNNDCQKSDYDFAIEGTAIPSALGVYQDTSVTLCGNLLLIPSYAPIGITKIASLSNTFRGIITVDPVTGNLRITNAKPVGVHTISLLSDINSRTTFTITVNDPVCTQTSFSNGPTSVVTRLTNITVADFNNDGKQDYAICTELGVVCIYFGNGTGGFSNTSCITMGSTGTMSIDAGDLNNDGNCDLIISGVVARLGNGNGTFGNAYYPLTSGGGNVVKLGDVNNDGNLDVVWTNTGSTTMGIALGTGTGTFTSSSSFFVSNYDKDLALEDFDKDGNMDIALSTSNDFNLKIFYGNGAGGFLQNNVPAMNYIKSLSTADFNNDGRMDICAITHSVDQKLIVILNNGNRTYSTGQFSINGIGSKVNTGDFNGDGWMDVVMSYTNGVTEIFIGNGLGGFTDTIPVDSNTDPRSNVVSDFNGDGINDVGIVFYDGNLFSVKTGSYGLGVQSLLTDITDGNTTYSVLNNTELGSVKLAAPSVRNYVIQNKSLDSVVLQSITLTGAQAGDYYVSGLTFPQHLPAGVSVNFNLTFTPSALGTRSAVVHINSDICGSNDYDFAVKGTGANISLGNYSNTSVIAGKNTLVNSAGSPQTSGARIYAYTSSSFKGEFLVNQISGAVRIINAQPAGTYIISVKVQHNPVVKTFTLTVNNPLCSNGNFSPPVLSGSSIQNDFMDMGDINNDGYVDLLTVHYSGSDYQFLYGNAAGTFTPGMTVSLPDFPVSALIADFNNDGIADIATAIDAGFSTPSILIGLLAGNGNIFASYTIPISFRPRQIIAQDFNDDGNMDIACISQAGPVAIYLGTGLGTLIKVSDIVVDNAEFITSGDFNNDGKKDLAITGSYSGGTTYIRLGDGNGNFTGTTSYATGPGTGMTTGDFNNDNNQDLAVVTSAVSNNLVVLSGNGQGVFQTSATYTVGTALRSVTTGDLNSDGITDLAIVKSAFCYTLLGRGDGTFMTGATVQTNWDTKHMFVYDINNDGVQDLFLGHSQSTFSTALGTYKGINVMGNGQAIPDGSTTISSSNFTDLGNTLLSVPGSRIYSINWEGADTLLLSNITLTGANASEFSISNVTLPSSLSQNGTLNFTLTCTPASPGVKTATVHIYNNDCQKPDYDFVVQATGVCVTPAFTIFPLNMPVNALTGYCSALVNYNVTTNDTTSTLAFLLTGATTGAGPGSGSGLVFRDGTTHVSITMTNACSSLTNSFDITVVSAIDDNNVCTIDACNQATGIISHASVNSEDGDICTVDGCDPVTGIFNTPVVTDDQNACTVDLCDPYTGLVLNIPVNIDDQNACTIDNCDVQTGIVTNMPVNIDDNNACTADACDVLTGVISNIVINTDDGIAFTEDGCDSITGVFHNPVFYLKLYLEGYYTGNGMMDHGTGGTLYTMGLSNNQTDVDTVELFFFDTHIMNDIVSAKGILQTNGTVRIPFNTTMSGNYYLHVRHRNTIETWSSVIVSLATTNTYDFTDVQSRAYGSNQVLTSDQSYWAMYSGDVTDASSVIGAQNGIVEFYDFFMIEDHVDSITKGFYTVDITGDGVVEDWDYSIVWNNFYAAIITMRP